jgi:hypothetical protein
MSTARTEPDLSEDLLRGAETIGTFMFGDNDPNARKRVYYLASDARCKNRLPVFRLGNVLCARKSRILQYIAEQESGTSS